MKTIGRIVRYSGVILIFIFSFLSIFFSDLARDLTNPRLQELWSYASYFEAPFFDYRMKKTLKRDTKAPHMVMAAIDDASLNTIGRWPWPRRVWIDFLDRMQHFGAKVLAFDVIFPEEEISCNNESPDGLFAEKITQFQSGDGKKVILAYSLTSEGGHNPYFEEAPGELLYNVVDTRQTGDGGLISFKVDKQTFPISALLKAEPGLGFIDARGDFDGVYRHNWLLANVDNSLVYPSLSLLAYSSYSGDQILLEINQGQASLKTKNGTLPLNSVGEAKVRYLGGSESFETISIKDVLKAPLDNPKMKKIFQDKIVFIGSTAYAAHDLRHTPVDNVLPGVYFHMNMANMLLHGHFFKDSAESIKYSLLLLCVGMLLMLLMQLVDNAILHLLTVAGISLGAYFLDTYYLLPQGLETKLFFILFCFIASYGWNTFINFYLTSKEKRQIRGAFSRYVAPAIVNQMLQNPDKLKLGGEKKDITCIFSDVRDFTSISEKLTPQQLSMALNQYMSKMTDILFETYGTLDKYIGDAIVGYWGAPVEVAHHPYHAVRGAVKMIETLPEINAQFKKEGLPEFKIGIGLNTGECSVGNMGSNTIFSYTALGDNMNLGSRLEGLCKFYGAQLIISEFTFERLTPEQKSQFAIRILDKVRVKGKEKPVVIYEVLPSMHPFHKDKEALDLYHQAYDLYLSQKFKEAKAILEKLHQKYPDDKSTKRLLEACDGYLVTPPVPEWDGVTVYKEK